MKNRAWIIALVIVLIGLFFAFDLGHFLSLDALKASRDGLQQAYQTQPLLVITLFAATYIIMAALSLPGAAVMSIAGGAIFGLLVGTLVVVVSASIGATLAFLVARFVLRDSVQKRFGDRLSSINAGIEKDGAFYLFTLRLVPVVPFFLINLLMGLTTIRTLTFFWVSLVGMVAGTSVYANAGTQLAALTSLSGILSPGLIGAFVMLAAFPWLTRWIVEKVKSKRIYARWPKPKQFDRNLVVIGAGAAGLVTSYIAAATRAKVTLIEGHKLGGDCLNYGCVPSKAIIRSATFVNQAKHAEKLGIAKADIEYNFADVMQRVHRVVSTVEPHDSVERYTKLGVDVVQGYARITSPWTVEVNGQTLTTRAIVIATGGRPTIPNIPGLDQVTHYTSDTIWSLTERPNRFVVLGGGPIGCELTQAFARLDCKVTLVVRSGLMGKEDADAVALVEEALIADGVRVMTHTNTVRCERDENGQRLIVSNKDGVEEAIEFDALLCAVGRTARTEGFGLEELGIKLSKNKTVEVDAWLQTNYPNIYAAGDVAGPYQFTHTAAHQAWYASVNTLFGSLKRFKADYSVIPWATFTSPEVARVGLSENEAKEQGIAYEVVKYGLDDLDRAIADEAAHGFVKVLTVPGKDKILGAAIVGEHAGDLLAEYVLAMKHGLGMNKILGTIHTYPTWSEANKYAAGEWKRAHVPHRILKFVEKYHTWKRG
ncbi:MAG: FAD-dependent oxidoreductase [Methylotenera sp.]|nr:FAD-dependent oxidoreductase [Methylotenera sp.]MDD4927050.1 FAD-dependent oxidoreductase [Methylotenera sp.]